MKKEEGIKKEERRSLRRRIQQTRFGINLRKYVKIKGFVDYVMIISGIMMWSIILHEFIHVLQTWMSGEYVTKICLVAGSENYLGVFSAMPKLWWTEPQAYFVQCVFVVIVTYGIVKWRVRE